jgi:hypothetical protein
MKSNFVKMNRGALRLACASAFAVAAMSTAISSHAASTSADATATVIVPIAITKNADLAFGKFAAGAGGDVVMSTAGARSSTGGIVLSTVTPGNAASFAVSGDANATYAITLPANATLTSGANTMTVASFTSNPSTTGTLSAGGTATLLVGGTLSVASAQAAGSYSGSFSVTVEYN